MSNIASNVAELIGNTPLVRINKLAGEGVDVVAKVEAFNPASSVKDRIAASIIDTAEESGALKPGGTIIEATSGNTGIALSMVGAARGYKVVIVMPASISLERRIIVRAFGAELVLTDPKGGVSAAVAEAERIHDERPGSIIASQFANPANPAIHVAPKYPLRPLDVVVVGARTVALTRRHPLEEKQGSHQACTRPTLVASTRLESAPRWTCLTRSRR